MNDELQYVTPMPELPLAELLSTEIDSGTVLRPGDVLLLGAPAAITLQQMEMVREHLRERLPKLADVIILGGLTVQAVFRDDKEDDDE